MCLAIHSPYVVPLSFSARYAKRISHSRARTCVMITRTRRLVPARQENEKAMWPIPLPLRPAQTGSGPARPRSAHHCCGQIRRHDCSVPIARHQPVPYSAARHHTRITAGSYCLSFAVRFTTSYDAPCRPVLISHFVAPDVARDSYSLRIYPPNR